MISFRRTVTEAQSPVLEELIPGSNQLVLAFGGIKGALGMPTFEFYQSSNVTNVSRIFFRDLSQSWYHLGLRGVTTNIDETADYIRATIQRLSPEKVTFIGNSMGGYAAILFSTLLDTGRVISFAPQTFISAEKRRQAGDSRWRIPVLRTRMESFFKPRYFDLEDLLRASGRNNRIEIYASRRDRLDTIHAQSLAGFSNVKLHLFDMGGHRLVKDLRDQGILREILLGAPLPDQ